MSSTLIYSDKCKHSATILQFIKNHPQLQQILAFHNISSMGVPDRRITRVPTMVTKQGNVLVGNEIKKWLESLLPTEITNCPIGGSGLGIYSISGTDDDGGLFALDNYGVSLQPNMTPELKSKIDKSVSEAFNEVKR